MEAEEDADVDVDVGVENEEDAADTNNIPHGIPMEEIPIGDTHREEEVHILAWLHEAEAACWADCPQWDNVRILLVGHEEMPSSWEWGGWIRRHIREVGHVHSRLVEVVVDGRHSVVVVVVMVVVDSNVRKEEEQEPLAETTAVFVSWKAIHRVASYP